MTSGTITFGQYIPRDSFMHSLDPRAKLVLITAGLVWVFASRDLFSFSICAGAFFLCAILSRLPAKIYLRSLWNVRFLILIAALMQLFGNDWWGVLKIASRLSLLILFASLLPLTSSPMEIADALGTVFPQEVAVMTMAALRFIPLLAEEMERIKRAQICRGAKFDDGTKNIFKRAIAYFPILIPLFVIVFKRADELSVAMEARCYRIGAKRSRLRPLEWKKIDTCATIFSVCAIMLRII